MRRDIQPRAAAAPLNGDINVTPMIDVLLVLLIIFMAAIPTMRRSVDIQLPERTQRQPASTVPSIVLELDADGGASINQAPVAPGALGARLRAVYGGRPDKVLFVKASPRLRYAAVVEAMDVARGAGVRVIGIP
jgi:biopolymer transport protein TolR